MSGGTTFGAVPARVNQPLPHHTADCATCDGTGRHYFERSIEIDSEDLHAIGIALPVARLTTDVVVIEHSRLCATCNGSGKVDRSVRSAITYAELRQSEDLPPEPEPGIVPVRPMEIP